MEKQAKKDLVITGRTVVRMVQVLTCLCLIWVIIQDMLGWQALEASTVTLLVCGLAGLETSLQARKKEKEDDKTP